MAKVFTQSKDQAENLGAEEHIELLHGSHQEMICLSTAKATRRSWRDQTCQHDEVLQLCLDLVGDEERSTYVSQAGFSAKRCVQNVAALPALFCDLDTYRVPALANKKPEQILEIVLREQPWLPRPTLLAHSGRGLYLIWLLQPILKREDLPDWQAVEVLLVGKLAPYGADQSAKDAARVLRLCGSINLRSGKRVKYWRIGEKIPFATMQTVILKTYQTEKAEEKPKPPKPKPAPPKLVVHNPKVKSRPATTKQIAISGDVISLYSELSLNFARMQDLRRIGKIRSPMKDYRKRILFCFAVAVSWYCPTRETMERELTYFVQNFFAEKEKYGVDLVKNVIAKAKDQRYRIRNKTIIAMLGITKFEQHGNRTLISSHHVWQRREAKRRAEGIRPREEYLAQQNAEYTQRKQKALELRKQGYKQHEIAQELGVDIRTVKRYHSKT